MNIRPPARSVLGGLSLVAVTLTTAGCGDGSDILMAAPAPIEVSGQAVHYFTTAVTHSETPTEGGMESRTTDIIRLSGDLDGYILYHPTTTIDFAAQTLVNTGVQFFSGTVAGGEPVVLYDDSFRFEVDLATGATLGTVHLGRSASSPHPSTWWECDLEIVGTGSTPEGDGLADYTGSCTQQGAASGGQ